MAVLKAYFDASMTNPIGVTAIGGHIATTEAWEDLEARWREALKYWELECFHLSAIVPTMGHEKGALCIRNFVRTIDGTQLRGLSAGIRDADWDELVSEPKWAHLRATFPTRYHVVLDMLFRELGDAMGLDHKGDQVEVVIDTDFQPTALAQSMFEELKNERYAQRFASLEFGHAPSCIPLQVADLSVGLQRRHWVDCGFLGEGDSPAYLPMTADIRAMLSAQGQFSRQTMWSFELAERAIAARERAENNRSM